MGKNNFDFVKCNLPETFVLEKIFIKDVLFKYSSKRTLLKNHFLKKYFCIQNGVIY